MGANQRQLKNRIRSVSSTMHITKAMQLVGEFREIPITSRDETGELTRVFNAMGTRITKNIQMLQDLLRSFLTKTHFQ